MEHPMQQVPQAVSLVVFSLVPKLKLQGATTSLLHVYMLWSFREHRSFTFIFF